MCLSFDSVTWCFSFFANEFVGWLSSGKVEEVGLLSAGGKVGLFCSSVGIDADFIHVVCEEAGLLLVVGTV